MNISNTINGPGIGGESILNTPKQSSENRGGFWSALAAASAEKPAGSEMLYSKTQRTEPDDEAIAALAAKYNPSDMSREEYEAFLNELESMGAITAADHERMKGYFLVDADPSLRGDLQRKLNTLSFSNAGEYMGQKALSGIVCRIDGVINGMSLLEQAADGKLWTNLQQFIIENAREKEQQKKEDEKLELLNLMLDSMTGRLEPRVSAAVGVKLGLSADQDIMKAGYLPSELYTYLLAVSSQTVGEIVDEAEDEESKVEMVDGIATEKLYANSEGRQGLTADDLADLAKRYDPNNMTREQYDGFLEDMVRLGVASQSMIERFGYHGKTAETVIPYEAAGISAAAFTPSPIDGDIEGWIQNRVLWKPGITREAAKRAGLSSEYETIVEEEKTLSRIAEVLADVRRQRYPSIINL